MRWCRPNWRATGRTCRWPRAATSRRSTPPALAGYVNIQALANELCGECWLEQGQPRVAAVFLRDAIARITASGAPRARRRNCARATPLLRASAGAGHAMRDAGARRRGAGARGGNSALDLVSLLKAAQTLSNEVGLRNVLQRLIAIVRENSGAQVARLLLLSDGACRLEADIDGDAVTVLQARRSTSMPPAIRSFRCRCCAT